MELFQLLIVMGIRKPQETETKARGYYPAANNQTSSLLLKYILGLFYGTICFASTSKQTIWHY